MTSKIFIVGPSWVGDMVMAQSLFIALRQLHPSAQIDVLAPAWSHPIIDAMPQVNRAIEMPLGHGVLDIGTRRKLGKSLRAENYDWAIVLPNSYKSALIPWFANIPRRTGWKGESRYGVLNDLRKLDKQAYGLMVERYVGLAYPEGTLPAAYDCPQPKLEPSQDAVRIALEKYDLLLGSDILGLCPGAEFGRAKKWPEKHYASVAQEHIRKGGQVWIFGSQNDVPAANAIASKLNTDAVQVLAGKTSLQEAVALLSVCHQVVSNDSGLMHVAAALGRKLVALFGSTSPAYTPPQQDDAVVLTADIECSPCFKRECPYGHYKCLEEMAPERVIHALDTQNN